LKRGLQLFALVSAVGVAVLLVYTGEWTATLEAFARVHPWWLLGALVLASSDWVGGGLRIWLLTRQVHRRTPFRGMVVAGGLTAWAAYLTPAQAGGGPVMIYTMKRYGVPIPEAMTSTLMSFVTTMVFFAIAGPVAVVLGAGRSLAAHDIPLVNLSLYDLFAASAATFSVIGALMLFMLAFPSAAARLFHGAIAWLERHHGERFARRVEAMRSGVDRMHECVLAYVRRPSGWLAMLVGVFTSGLAHANRLVAGYVALRALGIEAHFVDVLILQTTISFLLYFAPTPGGAGAAEALSAAMMSVYVPNALLPAYTIIWRFTVSYATVIVGSGIFYRLLHGRLDEALAEAQAAAPLAV
jgi:uncharacterized protein (TIRG00374 family)